MTTIKSPKAKWSGVGVSADFNTKVMHDHMQDLRKSTGPNTTLKSYLADAFGPDMTPASFYQTLGIDLGSMNVEKMLNTSDLNRWLFPEVVRDAILTGLAYTPFYGVLVAGEENIDSTGITMPSMDFSSIDRNEVKMRDVHEGADITEGQIVTWSEKQVTIRKKGRGLRQTYESVMFTPLDLAAIYFEEMGTQLGADLDADLINIAFNGDQVDGSQAAPVIGAQTANALAYTDILRAWVRFARIGRQSTVMLASENDATSILNMAEFKKTQIPNGVTPSGITLNVNRPLPTSQDIFTHDAIPDGKIIFVDKRRFAIQLTAMPLLIESEKVIQRQLQAQFASIITGFANIFKDGRMVLDYTTNLTTNPGPTVPIR